MRILLINHYAGTPEMGMEYRPYYLAREWVRQGHQVIIVGGSFSHLRKEQPKSKCGIIDGIQYVWIKLNSYKGNGIGRVLSMFVFVSKLYWGYCNYLKDFQPDIVIASSTYPLDIYPACRIANHYKAKLVYEVHDLWPLSPIQIGGYSKYHPFIMLMQKAENDCYKYCDKVVSLLANAFVHMKEHGLTEDKFVYVPNGFVMEEWNAGIKLNDNHSKVINDLHNDGFYILGYAGGHALSNALDYLLDAMKLVKNKKIICLLVGKGQEKARLEERAKIEHINNVLFLNPIAKVEIPSLLEQMDGLYIGWENNPLYQYGISPNKLIDYMMSGKPIIHSVNSTIDWVKEADCGISVEAENVTAIAEAIDNLFSKNYPLYKAKGTKGRKYAIENMAYPVLAKRFIDCIE